MEFITDNFNETFRLAGCLLEKLLKSPRCGALVLALRGDLGAGKTIFAQGLGKALGVEDKILSPTFVIMKHFDIPSPGEFKNFYHFDCYRLDGEKDLAGLNFSEIINNAGNIAVIEWAEKIKGVLPLDAVWLDFEHRGGNKRRIILHF